MERQATKAPAEVRKLVKCFQDNRDQYTASGYNETQLRRAFVELRRLHRHEALDSRLRHGWARGAAGEKKAALSRSSNRGLRPI